MFDDDNTKDRFTVSANVNVGNEDNRHISITKTSEGHVSEWLDTFKSILQAVGFSVSEVIVVMGDGETEFNDQYEFSI